MKYIGENFETVESHDDSFFIWQYNHKKRTFEVQIQPVWHEVQSDAYRMKIGKSEFLLPANYFIMIADVETNIDFIRGDEIAGRPFETLSFSSELEPGSWEVVDMEVVGYEQDVLFYYPNTRMPVPVQIDDNRAILISMSDLYSKMKDKSFAEII